MLTQMRFRARYLGHLSVAAVAFAFLLATPADARRARGSLSGPQGSGDGAGRYELLITAFEVSGRKQSGRAWDADGSYADVRFSIRYGEGTGVSAVDRKRGGVHRDRASGNGPAEDRWVFDWDGVGSVILVAVDEDLIDDDFIAQADIRSGNHPATGRVRLEGGVGAVSASGTADVVLAWKRIGDLPGMTPAQVEKTRTVPAAAPTRPFQPAVAVVARTGWSSRGDAFGACFDVCRGGKVKGREVVTFDPLSAGEWSALAIQNSDPLRLPLPIGPYSVDVASGDDAYDWRIEVKGPRGLEAPLYEGKELALSLGHQAPDFFLSPDGESLGFSLAATPSEADDAVTYYTVGAFRLRPAAAFAMNVAGLKKHKGMRYPDAIAYYTAALDLDPDYHVARYNRACARALSGDVIAATEDIRALLSADRKNYLKKIRIDRDFDGIRADERFQAAIR